MNHFQTATITTPPLLLILVMSLVGPASTDPRKPPAPREVTYVANVENLTDLKVHYNGRAWIPNPQGYLLGRGRGHQATMVPPPAEGDFRVNVEMTLPSSGKASAITFGFDDRIILRSGERDVTIEGRFFRAADKPIDVTGPIIPPGQNIAFSLERKGDTAFVKINGEDVYSGPCDPGKLSLLGVDPVDGVVHLSTMSATGSFSAEERKAFDNPFGMQKRILPGSAKEVFAPVIVEPAPTNECSVVSRRDGTLEIYFATKPASNSISVIRSKDGGLTWTKPAIAIPLPGEIYYAVMVTETEDGRLHAVFHILGKGPGGYRGRLYEVYHASTSADGSWHPPQRVIPGYVGSIRGFIQLSSGRLVLAVGVAVPEREKKPVSGMDFGWNETVVYTSDDGGKAWKKSPYILKFPLDGEFSTRYGAIEPALVQLNDGRIWMLIRDRSGSFYESFSADGSQWTDPSKATFITSDSPASFVKLKGGKIILLANACQNWSDPKSYAKGGREVLQAAITGDDGKTWSGFRDVLHETDGPAGGDRGSAYASAVETQDGKICLVSGQGEGKRAIVLFDPKWLEESSVHDDLESAPVLWAQYGDNGLRGETGENGERIVSFPLKSSGLCGATWNFPAARKGKLNLRIFIPKGVVSGALGLTDHFNRADDDKASAHCVFLVPFDNNNGLIAGQWNDINIAWDEAGALVTSNGRPGEKIMPSRQSSHGLNYLRLEFRSTQDEGSVQISDLTLTHN